MRLKDQQEFGLKEFTKLSNVMRNHDGVKITRKSLAWLNAHARYDDHHPDEALEIIKAFATTEEEQQKSIRAVKNGMSYYAMAAKASYETHKNSNGETLSSYSYGGNGAKA